MQYTRLLFPSNESTGTLGSLVSFGINFNASALQVPIAVYVVFIVLMASGFFLTCFTILPPSRVRRPDGTALAHYPHEGFWHELKAQSKLFSDWRLLAMFVPLFGSEIVVIVNSTLNCECKSHSSMVLKWPVFIASSSLILQHSDTLSQLCLLQPNANCWSHLDWYPAR